MSPVSTAANALSRCRVLPARSHPPTRADKSPFARNAEETGMSIWPVVVHSVLVAISFGVVLSKLGQPKTDKYDLHDLLIAPFVMISLLYWGGFYEPLVRGFK